MPKDTHNDLLMLTQFYKEEENGVLFNLYGTICADTMAKQTQVKNSQS